MDLNFRFLIRVQVSVDFGVRLVLAIRMAVGFRLYFRLGFRKRLRLRLRLQHFCFRLGTRLCEPFGFRLSQFLRRRFGRSIVLVVGFCFRMAFGPGIGFAVRLSKHLKIA